MLGLAIMLCGLFLLAASVIWKFLPSGSILGWRAAHSSGEAEP